MKKLLYIFIGMAIALGAVVLYSFKAKENAEVSYAMVMATTKEVFVYYGDGSREQATKIFNIGIGGSAYGQLHMSNAILKTLEYLHQKGYRIIGESQPIVIVPEFANHGGVGSSGSSNYSYTLIKQN